VAGAAVDLYANQLERISGLDAVPSLRVLMLGRNKIQTIEGLDAVPKLDVLDLHDNRLASMHGVGACATTPVALSLAHCSHLLVRHLDAAAEVERQAHPSLRRSSPLTSSWHPSCPSHQTHARGRREFMPDRFSEKDPLNSGLF
jgi:hypothetical protein